MPQNGRKITGILPIDRVAIEVLKTERYVKPVASGRACAIAENWSQAFFRGRREGFKRRIVREGNSRTGRSNLQLRDLDAHRCIDRSQASGEIDHGMGL